MTAAQSKVKVITVTSDKGGVGKTTTTENVGYELSQTVIPALGRKPKVLIVDVDPQHNLTNGFFAHDSDPELVSGSETIFSDNPQLSWSQALIGGEPAEGLFISVVNSRYGTAINSVNGRAGAERMILEAIDYTDHDFDFIIFDTQPAPHALAKHGALAAADIIILLVIDDVNSYKGALGIAQSTSRLNDNNPKILMIQNQFQKVRKSLNSQSVEWDNAAVEAIEEYKTSKAGRIKPFDFVSLDLKIPTASILSDAHSNGYPVALAKPSSPATKAFKDLVKTIVEHANVNI
ncbi:ParA family protein [Pseudomonas sp. PhalM4]